MDRQSSRRARRTDRSRHTSRPHRFARWVAAGCSAAAVSLTAVATPALAAPAVRAASNNAAAICSKVSASQVSSVVGYSVPNPTAQQATEVFDKRYGTTGTVTNCSYEPKGTSTKDILKTVELSYASLNKNVTVAEAESEIKATEGKTHKWTVQPYNSLSHPAVYLAYSSGGYTVAAILVVDGKKIAAAVVLTKMAESKLGKLAQLVTSAWF